MRRWGQPRKEAEQRERESRELDFSLADPHLALLHRGHPGGHFAAPISFHTACAMCYAAPAVLAALTAGKEEITRKHQKAKRALRVLGVWLWLPGSRLGQEIYESCHECESNHPVVGVKRKRDESEEIPSGRRTGHSSGEELPRGGPTQSTQSTQRGPRHFGKRLVPRSVAPCLLSLSLPPDPPSLC